jgi:hypothetical protein
MKDCFCLMHRRGKQHTALSFGAFALAIGGLAGCGGNDRPKTIPISGHVTIDGKAPGEDGKIFFTPTQAAAGYTMRPASGSFNAEGNYRVISWTPDDGLVPGHYTVNIMPGDLSKTSVPPRYYQSGTSGLEVDIPVDQGAIEYNIEVRSNSNANANANPNPRPNPSGR